MMSLHMMSLHVTSLHAVADSALFRAIGWTLAHSLWQGTLVALSLAAANGLALRGASARSRYCAACLALVALLALPLVTFCALRSSDSIAVVFGRTASPNVTPSATGRAALKAPDARAGAHARPGDSFDEEGARAPLTKWAGERFARALPWLALGCAVCVALLLARLAGGGVNEWRVGLLRAWLDAGMELGSEGFAHPNLFNVPLAKYEQDIERGRRLRYFSYPYLNVGPNRETNEAFERFLSVREMKSHKVTIDNLDWLFGKTYADARRADDEETMRRVADEYVPYIEGVLEFYEQLSRDTLGYEPPQVLMLTANALNCAKFDDLAAMLRRRGYSFVTLEEAQADKSYRQPDTYTGAWGISWLQRWAMARGAEFREEPYLSPYMEQFDTYTKKWQSIKVEVK